MISFLRHSLTPNLLNIQWCGCQTAIIVPLGGSFLFYKITFIYPQFNWGFTHAFSANNKSNTACQTSVSVPAMILSCWLLATRLKPTTGSWQLKALKPSLRVKRRVYYRNDESGKHDSVFCFPSSVSWFPFSVISIIDFSLFITIIVYRFLYKVFLWSFWNPNDGVSCQLLLLL